MIENLLAQQEGKNLEFIENTKSLSGIIQTIIAFTNTADGTLVIGIRGKTKEVVGLENILLEEERLANALASSVAPHISPVFQVVNYRGKELLVIGVMHSYGPYYLSSKGIAEGTFMRIGSINRLADANFIDEICRARVRRCFDELPNFEASMDDLDLDLAKKHFLREGKVFTAKTARSLGIVTEHQGKLFPTNGGILLFGRNPQRFFDNSQIRLLRYSGTTKADVVDFLDLDEPLVDAIESITAFIRRNTFMKTKIGEIQRDNIPQYLPQVVSEGIINALLHTDYSMRGATIQIAIFSDRIEITSPGGLPLGLNLEAAIAGISQLRNKTIGRVFKELRYIGSLGSGLTRMVDQCNRERVEPPIFEELEFFFRVTLYDKSCLTPYTPAEQKLVAYSEKSAKVSAKEAQGVYRLSPRTTSEMYV